MIYLIRNMTADFAILKIGYTKDINKRMSTYKTHNPTIELLYVGNGSKENEQFLHLYFERYRYDGSREWFYYTPIIIEYFKYRTNVTILDEVLINPILY